MPNELKNLELDEVSLVGKAANGKKFLIFKSMQKSKEGINVIKTKPAGARAGARASVSKADILDIVQKAVEPIRKENAKLRETLLKKDYEEIAKSHLGALGTPQEGAEILKSLESLPDEARTTILKGLKQANAAKREAMAVLGTQMGSSRPAPGSATAQFEAIVAKHDNIIQKSGNGPTDPKVRRAMAVSAATRENGRLAKAVLAEERAGVVRAQMGVQ
jgi:hypothetical protein